MKNINVRVFVSYFFLQSGLFVNSQYSEINKFAISECAARGGECDESKGHPVCGTDDQTYPSRCHLLRVQCSGYQVGLKYHGPCKACKEARDYALKHKTKFIPRCNSDGTYASIQCVKGTGCWCSDVIGKSIENTSVRTGKPKCAQHIKGNIRRSARRHLIPSHRICHQEARNIFNFNLIKVFENEYMRLFKPNKEYIFETNKTISVSPQRSNNILDWKFKQLDLNSNQILDRNEFRELKRLVKRVVKPRRCGKSFGKVCDINNDDRLSLIEWNTCIRHNISRKSLLSAENNSQMDIAQDLEKIVGSKFNEGIVTLTRANHNNVKNYPNNIFITNENKNDNTTKNQNNLLHTLFRNFENKSHEDDYGNNQRLDYDDDDYEIEQSQGNTNISPMNKTSSATNYPSIYFLRTNPETPLKDSEGESDCLTDRSAALEEQKHGNTILYVPDCTPDGRYQSIQCYRSTPYCWCVHEDTGKNIPGTSVKNMKPQCNSMKSDSRIMKGCPEPRRSVFINDLVLFLKSYIISNNNIRVNNTKWNSEEERIGTLSFVLLDQNQNNIFERKEWKAFRELMIKSKSLRKCGKRMPRFCDVNNDKAVTLIEWKNCLQPQKSAGQDLTFINESMTSKPLKLTGSNPLEQYLKD